MNTIVRARHVVHLVVTAVLSASLISLTAGPAGAVNPTDQFVFPLTGRVDANDVQWHQSNEGGVKAIDIQAGSGTVTAAAPGTVIWVGRTDNVTRSCTVTVKNKSKTISYQGSGVGNYVVIRHDQGPTTYYTLYGHLDEMRTTVNDQVSDGTPLGTVGSSGCSSGKHVHFEIGNAVRSGDMRIPVGNNLWNGPADYPSKATRVRQGDALPGTYPGLTVTPVVPPASGSITAVSAGDTNCVIVAGGAVKCAPGAYAADSGSYTTVPAVTAKALVGGDESGGFLEGWFTCALTMTNTVKCWGQNSTGSLGNGTFADSASPTDVVGLSDVNIVSAGAFGACATVGVARDLYCWGSNFRGEATGGTPTDSGVSSPFPVPGQTGIVGVARGANAACDVNSLGTVRCWGDWSRGLTGPDNYAAQSTTLTVVTGLPAVVELASSGATMCARTSAGAVYCWGTVDQRKTADGYDSVIDPTPRLVTGLPAASELTGGALHLCARTSSGDVWCWGNDDYDQIGDGTYGDNTLKIDLVPHKSNVTGALAIDGGAFSSCAVVPNGNMSCWGFSFLGPTIISGL